MQKDLHCDLKNNFLVHGGYLNEMSLGSWTHICHFSAFHNTVLVGQAI
jgi:hypothetical protein